MSETKHTPGPWFIHDNVSYDRIKEMNIGTYDIKNVPQGEAVKSTWIADVKPYGGTGFTDKETAHANAKLIAAAPDLLKELRLYVIACTCGNHRDGMIKINSTCHKCTSAVAVIAKATI